MKGFRRSSAGSNGDEPRLVPASRLPLLQSVVIVLGVTLIPALLLFLTVLPAERDAVQQESENRIEVLAERFNQHVGYIHQLVTAYGQRGPVVAAVQAQDGVADAEATLQSILPSARAVFLFPADGIAQPPERDFELGYASIDIARQAVAADSARMDGFRRNGDWLVQIAAPVKAADAESPTGSLLVIFESDVFEPVMVATTRALDGRVELLQDVDGSDHPIASMGQGRGDPLQRELEISGWSVRYTPDAGHAQLLSRISLWGLSVLVGVAMLLGLWLLYGRYQKRWQQEFTELGGWAQKAFSGERVDAPKPSMALLASLADSLNRLAGTVAQQTGSGQRPPGATSNGLAGLADDAPPPRPPELEGEDDTRDGDESLFDADELPDIDDLEEMDSSFQNEHHQGEDMTTAEAETTDVPASIFRAYDIRGVVDDSLTEEGVRVIGRAIGSEALDRGQDTVCVGYDGRHSGPALADALSEGLLSTGVNVIDVGRVPTPVLYFATHYLKTGSGVMVTGSHNPPEYNGLKMMLGGDTLAGDAIQGLLERIRAGRFAQGQGSRDSQDIRSAYLQRILEDIAVASPLKVVVDAGNGIAGEIGPRLVQELGCEVVPLYCQVDGNFPNHHPDPGKPENLEDLIRTIESEQADLGIAFDGDGDRLGVVTRSGKIIWPDRLLMLFAKDLLSRNPGADVIYDVKCSRRLANVINAEGGRPVMWKTGHSWVKAKMKESGALLAGEMSGHVFFKERWYGFDDGIYAAARLLEILGFEARDADEVFAEFPEDYSTPEINLQVSDDNKFSIISDLAQQADFGNGNITDIDGLRVDYADGWGLCRASNTTPVLVLRFEAETEEGLERIKAIFREQLARIAPDVTVTF